MMVGGAVVEPATVVVVDRAGWLVAAPAPGGEAAPTKKRETNQTTRRTAAAGESQLDRLEEIFGVGGATGSSLGRVGDPRSRSASMARWFRHSWTGVRTKAVGPHQPERSNADCTSRKSGSAQSAHRCASMNCQRCQNRVPITTRKATWGAGATRQTLQNLGIDRKA